MKKVLIMIPSFSLGGGAEKILSNILCSDNYNCTFDIVEIVRGKRGFEELPSNAKVVNYLYKEDDFRLIQLLKMGLGKKFPKFLRKFLIKKNDYDIEIQFEMMYPDVNFTNKNISKISWVHGSIEEMQQSKYLWRKKRYQKHFGDACKIITISNKSKQSIEELYPEYKDKIQIIYNGYTFDKIIERSKLVNVDMEDNAIVCVGRIETHKGSHINLEILKQLHQQGYLYHLYYIGSGELESLLKQRVKDYNLENYVHFKGYQSNPYPFIKKAKVLLSMSLQEGFPGVYVEAMALGVPFVSSDVGGSEELSCNGQFGKIVFNNNEACKAIVRYLEKEEIVDSKAMYNYISNFSIQKQSKQFKLLLD